MEAAASCSANLTPGHRHCRRSPADATEGNEPKTGRRRTKRRVRGHRLIDAAAGEVLATGRWSAGRRHARVRHAATDRPRSPQTARRLPTSSGRPRLSASISLGGRTAPGRTRQLRVRSLGTAAPPRAGPAAELAKLPVSHHRALHLSGRFSVRSPRSRRQGFAYSAGGRGSSSRCTRPPPARPTASART